MAKVRTINAGKEDRLVEAVAFGEMSREAAELFLNAPVERTPPRDSFDPLKETAWSLSMAIAWIVWRSADGVQSAWPTYRSQCIRWARNEPGVKYLRLGEPKPISDDDHLDNLEDEPFLESRPSLGFLVEAPEYGWNLQRLKPASLQTLEAEWNATKWPQLKSRYKDTEAARKELWALLLAGDLEATAISAEGDRVMTIPASEWLYLAGPFLNNQGEEFVGFRPDEPRYQRAVVPREMITDKWKMKGKELKGLSPILSKVCDVIIELCEHGTIRHNSRAEFINAEVRLFFEKKLNKEFGKPDAKTIRKARKVVFGESPKIPPPVSLTVPKT